MSILQIKEKFSKRILESEVEKNSVPKKENGLEKTAIPPVSLQEYEVGITEYVSDLPGFQGIIKQRYSDFNVHEIDMSGVKAVLNDFTVPSETLDLVNCETCEFLADKTIHDLQDLVDKDEIDKVDIDVTSNTKEERTKIHQFIKGKYGNSVISNTSENEDKKLIVVKRTSNNKSDERRPGHLPKYLHFILSKSNTDTNEALGVIGTKLKIKKQNFSYAGTKDKRANTTQWVCVKNVCASKLNPLNKFLRKMRIGNFKYSHHELSLGCLKGNNFQIALRNVNADPTEIEYALEKLSAQGFVNYFGLQRFGNTAECPTHELGRQLIKEAYAAVINLILKPRQCSESYDLRQAREIYANTKDPKHAVSALHKRDRSIEGQVLRALATHGPTAYVNALDSLPRNIILLYLHAYQSLIWNRVVSRRIKKYGFKVLPGDLVLSRSDDVVESAPPTENNEENKDETQDTPNTTSAVKLITEDDVKLYTIYDVLLPVPGYSIKYPKNDIAEWYNEILAESDLTSESFETRIKKYSLPGSYRKILAKPENMSWNIVKHAKPDDDLILSDIDILDGKTLEHDPNGKFSALILTFDLDRSTYATMALREILRMDTSTSSQRKMNIENDNGADTPSEATSPKRPKLEEKMDEERP